MESLKHELSLVGLSNEKFTTNNCFNNITKYIL